MADRTRPLLIGYFREIFFANASQRAATRQRLVEFAAQEGYALELILCQDFDQGQSEFERLLELIKFHGASAVVISEPADLDGAQRHRLEVETDAHVLVATSPP